MVDHLITGILPVTESQIPTPAHPDPEVEWSGFIVDRETAAQQKHARDRVHNRVHIPSLRLAGAFMLLTAVAMQRTFVQHIGLGTEFAGLATWLIAYSLISWALLARFYDSHTKLGLGAVFMAVDLALFMPPII